MQLNASLPEESCHGVSYAGASRSEKRAHDSESDMAQRIPQARPEKAALLVPLGERRTLNEGILRAVDLGTELTVRESSPLTSEFLGVRIANALLLTRAEGIRGLNPEAKKAETKCCDVAQSYGANSASNPDAVPLRLHQTQLSPTDSSVGSRPSA